MPAAADVLMQNTGDVLTPVPVAQIAFKTLSTGKEGRTQTTGV